jgi:hypothetical protein
MWCERLAAATSASATASSTTSTTRSPSPAARPTTGPTGTTSAAELSLAELAAIPLSHHALALLHLRLQSLHEGVHRHLQFGSIQRVVTVLVELSNHHLRQLCAATNPVSLAVTHLLCVALVGFRIASGWATALWAFAFSAALGLGGVESQHGHQEQAQTECYGGLHQTLLFLVVPDRKDMRAVTDLTRTRTF